jgi:hypothetical protein
VLSIDSQIKEMIQIAERDGLTIAEIRKESHSAKAVGQREVFNELLKDIRSGKFNGILTWAPDRLSRNAGDLGSLVDLMDQKALVEIRTFSQKFTNNPSEKFMLMILCSTAKLTVRAGATPQHGPNRISEREAEGQALRSDCRSDSRSHYPSNVREGRKRTMVGSEALRVAAA